MVEKKGVEIFVKTLCIKKTPVFFPLFCKKKKVFFFTHNLLHFASEFLISSQWCIVTLCHEMVAK
jgi:hypothetical protein